jgi:hypothetical protein
VWARVAVAVALLVVGLVWIGQGVGLIGGSFMSGHAVWAVIGVIVVLAALMVLRGVARDRRRRADES